MNENGHILFLIIGAFLILAILPVIISFVSPEAKLIMQVILIFTVYTTVRGLMGSGTLTIIISAILIYFMVFKYYEIFLALYILQLLLGLQFLSVIIWGVSTTMRKH